MSNLTLPAIADLYQGDAAARLQAQLQNNIDNKTKPRGSLGRLEELALQLGMVQNSLQPRLEQPGVFVFAADHGVMAEQVSAYPQCVTWQMVQNFLGGGAAVSVFARQFGLRLQVVDAGVMHEFAPHPDLLQHKIAWGTANFCQQPAMTDAQCAAALETGIALARNWPGNVLLLGEMGIGNTTAASALMCKLSALPLAQCVGAGTGLDARGVAHKQAVIARALDVHAAVHDPLHILACLGGLELAMLVGAMLGAASSRKLFIVDGFIVSAAFLLARALAPRVGQYAVFSHCSQEAGHKALLEHLQVKPLLQLEMRLGEASGAVLAWPLLQAALNFLNQMASFEAAAVSTGLEHTAAGTD